MIVLIVMCIVSILAIVGVIDMWKQINKIKEN